NKAANVIRQIVNEDGDLFRRLCFQVALVAKRVKVLSVAMIMMAYLVSVHKRLVAMPTSRCTVKVRLCRWGHNKRDVRHVTSASIDSVLNILHQFGSTPIPKTAIKFN